MNDEYIDTVANEFFTEYEAHEAHRQHKLYLKFHSMLEVDFTAESIKVFWNILQNTELSTDEKKDKIKSKLGKMDKEDYVWIYWVWGRINKKF